MSKDGIGWPRTYFVWGFTSGALAGEAILCIVTGKTGIGLFTGFLSVVAWICARHQQRPLFAERD